MPGFSVDTKLFRELGELLVGRESTALIELVKNAYDADATEVSIYGERIAQTGGSIVVADNGIGMSESEFSKGFLRIAGRYKSSDRRSPWFGRRFTGEKGVGRLAAHKLACALKVQSRRWNEKDRDEFAGFPASGEILAEIDWDAIEQLETLAEIEGSNAVRVQSTSGVSGMAGTRLTLSPLRRQWGSRETERFFDEVATLTPPGVLLGSLANVVASPLLKDLVLRDERRAGGFEIQFHGDLSLSEGDVPATLESASWIIEVDCDKAARRLRISISPTRKTLAEYSNAEGFVLDRPFDKDDPDVGFQARILQMSNGQWPRRYQGIRVYYEGFRVLPYGDPRDDWLSLDRDYRARGHSELGRLRGRSDWNLPQGSGKELLALQGSTAFFGAVLLTRSGADQLEMLVNREGFLPSAQFSFVEDIVRLAIDLQVRVRYAATSEVKQARTVARGRQQNAAKRAASGQTPSAFLLRELHDSARVALNSARVAVATGRSGDASKQLEQLEQALGSATDLSDEMTSEATMFRVLAAIGLEQAAFVHEVRSLSLAAQVLSDNLEKLASAEPDAEKKRQLRGIAGDARDIRERLRRNAVYLADVTGIEGRRRRIRQKLGDRLARVLGFFEAAIASRGISLSNDVSDELLTPPLFPAELTAILSNVLSNAIKFAGEQGRVSVSAVETPTNLKVRVENTGVTVDLATAERWFEPFRSTTQHVDESLGQGMGLGLTITRSLIDEYGGAIHFSEPTPGFSTAVELELPRT